jgi:hypothetical protein
MLSMLILPHSCTNSIRMLLVIMSVCVLLLAPARASAGRQLQDISTIAVGDYDACFGEDIVWIGGKPAPRRIIDRKCMHCTQADTTGVGYKATYESKINVGLDLPISAVSASLGLEEMESETVEFTDGCNHRTNTESAPHYFFL